MVIRHSDGKGDLDIRAYGGQSKAVDECGVGIVVGAQEKAPFRTAAGDHVVTTGHDLAGECHARVVGYAGKKLREKGPSEGDHTSATLLGLGPRRLVGARPVTIAAVTVVEPLSTITLSATTDSS